jgi:hypothetical protein
VGAPAADLRACRVFLVCGIRLRHEVPDALLRSWAAVSAIGRSSVNVRFSPLTEY